MFMHLWVGHPFKRRKTLTVRRYFALSVRPLPSVIGPYMWEEVIIELHVPFSRSFTVVNTRGIATDGEKRHLQLEKMSECPGTLVTASHIKKVRVQIEHIDRSQPSLFLPSFISSFAKASQVGFLMIIFILWRILLSSRGRLLDG